jgi:hypothetical protein
VIGASGMPSPRIDVLAIRFTPAGMLRSVVANGYAPSLTTLAPYAIAHWKKTWSWGLTAGVLRATSAQSRPVTTNAADR